MKYLLVDQGGMFGELYQPHKVVAIKDTPEEAQAAANIDYPCEWIGGVPVATGSLTVNPGKWRIIVWDNENVK